MLQVNTDSLIVREHRFRAAMHDSPVSDYAGDCQSPVSIRARGLPDQLMVGLGMEQDKVAVQYLEVRCRACQPCLDARRRLWTARAIDEVRFARRTWFGTLTVCPEKRFQADLKCASRAAVTSAGFRALSDAERYELRCAVLQDQVTRYLKRVRKHAPFRYLLVSEAHEDGYPHFHLLIHESKEPLTKRVLDNAWRNHRLGHTHFKLVEGERTSVYVCKYLNKSAQTRVRASQRYGQAPQSLITDALIASRVVLEETTRKDTA